MSSDFPLLMINFTQPLEPSCHERFSQTHSCNVGSHYSTYNYHVSLIKTQSQLWANKDIIIITLHVCTLNRYFYGVIGMEAFHDFEITFDTPTADHFFYNCGLGFINFRCSMYHHMKKLGDICMEFTPFHSIFPSRMKNNGHFWYIF